METNLEDVPMKDCESVTCPICKEKLDKIVVKNINCERCSAILHDRCFGGNTITFRNLKQELKCTCCRLSWESKSNTSTISGCKQGGLPVEDIDIITDESDPDLDKKI